MPGSYTHYRFGRDVLPLLPVELHARIDSHRSLFDLGLHGPDIFFYYNPLRKNPVNRLGHRMHTESGQAVFRRFAALDDGTNASFAYLAGFLCHFALDSLCHGYVEEMTAMGMSHTLLEAQLDRAFLLRDGRDPLTADLAAHIRPKSQNVRVISRFFPQLTENHVERTLKDVVFYHKLLLAKQKPKRATLNLVFRVANLQDGFGAMVMRENEVPACVPMVKHLQELHEEAIPAAVELISRYPELDADRYAFDFNGTLVPPVRGLPSEARPGV